MTSTGVWIPGRLPGTNEVLSLARAAGHYEGRRAAMVQSGQWRDGRHPPDHYAERARTVRGLVAALVRGRFAPVPAGQRVHLRFRVHGHPRWDPSAVYLAAKWVEDGLVDGGILRDDGREFVADISIGVCGWEWGLHPGPGIYVGWELAS